MGSIPDALEWSGSGATISLFLVTEASTPPALDADFKIQPPRSRTYHLEDEGARLPGRNVFEYDFVFSGLPPDYESTFCGLLDSARRAGALVAWLGFEGSFDFEFLLSPEIANQVYGLVDSEGVAIADDATLHSADWRERVVRAGDRLRRAPLDERR
jgi:hypothetical protein